MGESDEKARREWQMGKEVRRDRERKERREKGRRKGDGRVWRGETGLKEKERAKERKKA